MIAAVRKLVNPSPVQAVDDELGRVRSQLAALAQAEASSHEKCDELAAALRAVLEAGEPTDEIEAAILSERATLERLALRRVPLERLAVEKAAALNTKRHRLRVEALESAETSERAALVTLDREIVEAALVLSEKFSRRMKAEADAIQINGRLARIGERPEPTGGFGFNEDALVVAFLGRFPLASRSMPFGMRAWRSFEFSVPVLTPDPVTAAVAADDEMASE